MNERDTYVKWKALEAGHQAGQELAIPETYHRESRELIRKVVADVSAAVLAKATP
jgi:hypothetical protein